MVVLGLGCSSVLQKTGKPPKRKRINNRQYKAFWYAESDERDHLLPLLQVTVRVTAKALLVALLLPPLGGSTHKYTNQSINLLLTDIT